MREKPEANSDSTAGSDTTKVRALDGAPSAEEALTATALGTDPYNHTTTGIQFLSEKSKRRSLDDMRRLSEAIKRSRSQRQR
jgi:hypothetical protein